MTGPRPGDAAPGGRSEAAALEVIDPDDPSELQVEAIERACRTIGFFRIPFSAVDDGVREAAWDDATRFFARPTEEKLLVGFPEPGYPYGFSPFAFEALAASTGAEAPPDLKESFSVGPDCHRPSTGPSSGPATGPSARPAATSDDPAEAWLRSPSLWPTEPASLRTSWTACYRAMTDVATRLLSLMARAIDLPADHFDPLVDRHTGAMRAIHYPAIEGEPPAGALRAGAHSDYGTLTILRTDGVPGLEVQRPDGGWVAVADEPDTFVVNLGDSIAQWTNNRWRSTVHRVTTVDRSPRQSMAFFHMANWDASIECLPTCLGPGESPKHEPVLAGPWLMSKFQRSVGC
ncbi:MAG: 2OG-Fe(II) oxygenase family protein [Actinomycetota bacterium]